MMPTLLAHAESHDHYSPVELLIHVASYADHAWPWALAIGVGVAAVFYSRLRRERAAER